MTNADEMKIVTKPILLNLPLPLVQQLDHAASILRIPRTHLITRCIVRDLGSTLNQEVIQTKQYFETMNDKFGLWLNT